MGQIKPDPALYQVTLDALHLQANQAIAFEDSPRGILAAKRARVHCVAIPNLITRSLSMSQADLTLVSLTDAPLQKLLTWASGDPA